MHKRQACVLLGIRPALIPVKRCAVLLQPVKPVRAKRWGILDRALFWVEVKLARLGGQ